MLGYRFAYYLETAVGVTTVVLQLVFALLALEELLFPFFGIDYQAVTAYAALGVFARLCQPRGFDFP